MPFRLSVILAEPNRISFLSVGKLHFIRASCLFRGLNKFVLIGLGMSTMVCPSNSLLGTALPFSHLLQVMKVMGAIL